ncbi:unnamed protein product [Boreogadus saida]
MPTDRTITCHIFILFLLTSVTVILFCTAPLHNLIVTLAARPYKEVLSPPPCVPGPPDPPVPEQLPSVEPPAAV